VGALRPRVEREGAVGGDQQRGLQEGIDNGALCSSRPVDDIKAVFKPVGDLATLLYAHEEDHAVRNATGLVLRRIRRTRR
jgi:hypothetical protein